VGNRRVSGGAGDAIVGGGANADDAAAPAVALAARYTAHVPRPDPHSALDAAQPRVRHLDWRVRADFSARTLDAEARLVLDGDGERVDLDTRDLSIVSVDDGAGSPLPFEHGPPHPFLGQRLRVECGPARVLRIVYRTAPSASALQWLNQLVYSQCQPIQARTLVPLPDSPSARLTMRAQVTAPRALTVLMGGAFVDRVEHGDEAITTYEMVEPIAPYLLALAIGDFVARDLTPRTRVWATPQRLDDAARVLAGVGRILHAAEELLGPYRWRRFDLWIAPSSFPYGGMENPRLTFLSPSLLARDGSLLGVVAHELCHAWFGNLVGAASAEHLWINEGLAVYAERRLIERLDGEPAARLQAALGRRDLDRAFVAFGARPELTRLRTRLEGLDPDEALSIVPYEKGYLLLCALEAHLGRSALDRLLRAYLEHFAGQAITSDELAAFVATAAPDFPIDPWLNQSGLPSSAQPLATSAPAEMAMSARTEMAMSTPAEMAISAPMMATASAGLPFHDAAGPHRLAAIGEPASADLLPARDEAAAWSPWQWRWYLDGLPRPSALCATLDEWFNLSAADNAEVRAAWLPLAIESDHAPALSAIEQALDGGNERGAGRVKFLRPLYLALARNPATRDGVGGWWRRFRQGYHPVARQQLDRLLRELGIATQDVNPLSLRRRS
jgi:leukotriene-A4 hydrolase